MPEKAIAKRMATRKKHGPYYHTEKSKQKIGLFQKARKHAPTSPETKLKLSVAGMDRVVADRTRSILSEKGKLYWGSVPEATARNRIAKAMKASNSATGKHPNGFEQRAMEVLNRAFRNKFVFTGDGTKIVNRRSADAYSEELKAVALFHGCYWHLRRNGMDVFDANKRIVEENDALPFLEAGYRVVFIWEDEIAKIIEVNFCGK